MKKLKIIKIINSLIIVITFILNTNSFAQTEDKCGCNAVLINGVYNHRELKGDFINKEEIERYIARTSYDDFKKSGSAGGGFSIKSFGFNTNMNIDDYEKRQKVFRKKYKDYRITENSQELMEKYGDINVLNAWSMCKSNCNVNGLYSWITIDDAHYMDLHIKWVPTPGSDKLEVENSSIVGAKVIDTLLPGGKIFKNKKYIPAGETIVSIKRKNQDNPVKINIKISGRDISEYIPRYIPPPLSSTHEELSKKGSDSYYKDKDFLKAEKYLIKAGDMGDLHAQATLGHLYYYGYKERIGKPNVDKALYWLLKGTEKDYLYSLSTAGTIYYYEKCDLTKAKELLEKAALQNDAHAQATLGNLYYYGHEKCGGKQDIEKAIFWLEKAANQGNKFAIETRKRIKK